MRKILDPAICFLFFLMIFSVPVKGSEKITEELMGKMEFDEVQDMLNEMLGEGSFSFSEALKNLVTGQETLSKEAVQKFLRSLFFSGFSKEKTLFLRILLLILLSAIFSGFGDIFDSGQTGEISFYVVYLLLFTMLMDSFSSLCVNLSENLSWLSRFMKVLSPAYFLAVAASSGGTTAAVFYEGVLLLVWLIQWILMEILLPGIHIYTVVRFVNNLSREEMLGKLSELLETGINWGMKTLLGFVIGLQVVKNLVAPVMDSLKRSVAGKAAGAIPGVGNAVNAVTELIVTGAVLVRNSLGIVVLIALLLVGAGPVIHYGMLSLSYRFLAAVAQPVSDKRIVGCLSTMGESCGLLLRLLLMVDVLCMLTFIILMVSFGGGP